MYFPSKRDKWITALIWGISLLGIIVPLLSRQFIASAIMLVLASLLLWFWFQTGYHVGEEKIKIYYGPIRQTVNIADIELIIISKMPINSPALSLKRIQISSGKYEIVAVSPLDREGFITALLKRRPDIPIDERLLPKEFKEITKQPRT